MQVTAALRDRFAMAEHSSTMAPAVDVTIIASYAPEE